MDSEGGASLHGELTFAELLQHVHQGSVPALATVSPDQSLLRAQSLMMSRDFSQLPVMSGSRSCQGAVTWASMAKALSRDACSQLKDCIEPAVLLDAGDDVFGSIDKITAADFVLVRDETRQPYAIITTTDLAFAFETVTGPFLLLGVIEGLLRSVVEERLHVDRITAVQKFDVETERAVEGLTLGELASLNDNDDNWVRLGLTRIRE